MRPNFGEVLEDDLTKALDEIRRRCERAVRRETLTHYTDHTISHLDQVAQNFLDLARSNRNSESKLLEFEYFVGLAACYYHDVALQRTVAAQKDVDRLTAYDYVFQRNQHGVAASNWIKQEITGSGLEPGDPGPPPLGTNFSDVSAKLCLAAAPLCFYHCANPPESPLKEPTLLGQKIRSNLLLALLRLADALHLDFNRVDMDQIKQHQLPVESEMHWWRHHYTDSVSIDDTGLIEIVMSFPNLSKPEQDFFQNETLEYVQRELGNFKKILRKNKMTIDVLPITVDDIFSGTKQKPSDLLTNYLVSLGKIPAAIESSDEPIKVKGGRKRTRSFADSEWGVKGHPWTDLPTSYVREEFVETQNMKKYIESVERFLESPKGEIRMVYGARGAGKTTFLHSIRDEFSVAARTIYLDLSLVLGGVESATQLYAWLFENILDELDAEHGPIDLREIPQMVRGSLAQVNGPVIILIDNMDRYLDQPDIATIKRFFEIAQRSLEDLQSRCSVLITAHEKWKEFLDHEDLSYLGAAPSWQLNPMDASETRDLIDKRLRISGSSYDRMFEFDAFKLIHRVTEGNPRQTVSTCGYLFEEAISRHYSPIDDSFIREYVGSKLGHKVHAALNEIGSSKPVVKKLMSSGYRFHQAVELTKYSQNFAWTLAKNLLETGKFSIETVPEDLRTGFSELAEIRTEGSYFYWVPKKQVQGAIDILRQEKISIREFVKTYEAKPIAPKGANIAELKMSGARRLSVGASKLSQTSREFENQFQEKEAGKNIALSARFALEYKILSYLSEANIVRPAQYEFHENGIIKIGSRHVKKFGWKHRRDLKLLINALRKHKYHFTSLQKMTLLEEETSSFLENSPMSVPDDDYELMSLCLEKCIRELDSAVGSLQNFN